MLDFIDGQRMVTEKMEPALRNRWVREYTKKSRELKGEPVPFEYFCEWITKVAQEGANAGVIFSTEEKPREMGNYFLKIIDLFRPLNKLLVLIQFLICCKKQSL